MPKTKTTSSNSSSARTGPRLAVPLQVKKAKLLESQAKLLQTQKTLELKENRENISKFKLQKKEEETELTSNFAEEGQQSLLLKFPGYKEHFDNYVAKREKALFERIPHYNAEYMKGK
jgi:hypothetical protein